MIATLAACGDNGDALPDAPTGPDAPVADAAVPPDGSITTPACSTVSGTSSVSFTTDEGATFAATPPLTSTTYVYGLVGLSTPGALLAAVDADVLRSDDAGCSWKRIGTVDTDDAELLRMVADDAGHAYGYGDNRHVVFSVDDGVVAHATDWSIIGMTPNGAAGHVRVVDGDHVQLQETEDGGATWTRLGVSAFGDGPQVAYRGVFDPTDPDHVLIGASGGGVRITRDGGATWTSASGLPKPANVFSIAFSEASPNVVWIEALSGADAIRHVYRSTDGGDSFTSMLDESPEVDLINGTLLAPHPTDPNILYLTYGQSYQNYGTDLYRFDATTRAVTTAHHAAHGIEAVAFPAWNPSVMYLGLSHENVD